MTCNEIIKYIEDWAPKGAAWDRDNVGLQIGSRSRKLKNILLSLDLTGKVVEEAIKKKCNLIITHHPLLFNPLKTIDIQNDTTSILVEKIIKNDITLYSAHTNLDFTKDGVSFELAKKLKLKKIDFLVNLKSNQYKLVVFIPENETEKVADAIFKAGGGIIGEYSNCSFSVPGKGSFKGSENSNPALGVKGKLEKVDEIRLEVLVDKWNLNKVINKMKEAHSYEEPAFDIYPLNNNNVNYGVGAVGELEKSLSTGEFLKHISKSLNVRNFRYSSGKSNKIKRVAVCGGSGSEYIKSAIDSGADVFITADVKYHSFQEAEGKILLIDAGHYETEVHSLNEVKKRIELYLQKNKTINVFKFSGSTNPVNFYNN